MILSQIGGFFALRHDVRGPIRRRRLRVIAVCTVRHLIRRVNTPRVRRAHVVLRTWILLLWWLVAMVAVWRLVARRVGTAIARRLLLQMTVAVVTFKCRLNRKHRRMLAALFANSG